MRRNGLALLAGGVLWLTGVVLLESGTDVDSLAVRATFLVAGLLLAVDLYVLRSRLPARTAKVGVICSALTCAGIGVGFASGGFIGFLLAYYGLLFTLPLGLVLVGIGLRTGGGLPSWAVWIPVLLAAAGAITYGFHALAPDLWDPPDSVMFIILGVGWLLLAAAALSPFRSVEA